MWKTFGFCFFSRDDGLFLATTRRRNGFFSRNDVTVFYSRNDATLFFVAPVASLREKKPKKESITIEMVFTAIYFDKKT